MTEEQRRLRAYFSSKSFYTIVWSRKKIVFGGTHKSIANVREMNDRVLISDKAHPCLEEKLSKAGLVVDYRPDISYEEFQSVFDRYEGLIINSKTPMPAENFDKSERLKFIGRLGSGLDIIDLDKAEKSGVAVLNAPEGNANAVAEHALGMLLALNHNICKANYELKDFSWKREQNRGVELEGKTLGIIGYGNNGSAFASKLAGLNVKVLAFDKYKQRYADQVRYVVESSLTEVLKNVDVLSLHIPLNDETHYMVDESFLGKCKPGVILINTSRGKIVKTVDLMKCLENGQVGGACLDVLENEHVNAYSEEEKEILRRLVQNEKVILSPHIAGWTKESLKKIAQVLAVKVLKLYD